MAIDPASQPDVGQQSDIPTTDILFDEKCVNLLKFEEWLRTTESSLKSTVSNTFLGVDLPTDQTHEPKPLRTVLGKAKRSVRVRLVDYDGDDLDSDAVLDQWFYRFSLDDSHDLSGNRSAFAAQVSQDTSNMIGSIYCSSTHQDLADQDRDATAVPHVVILDMDSAHRVATVLAEILNCLPEIPGFCSSYLGLDDFSIQCIYLRSAILEAVPHLRGWLPTPQVSRQSTDPNSIGYDTVSSRVEILDPSSGRLQSLFIGANISRVSMEDAEITLPLTHHAFQASMQEDTDMEAFDEQEASKVLYASRAVRWMASQLLLRPAPYLQLSHYRLVFVPFPFSDVLTVL